MYYSSLKVSAGFTMAAFIILPPIVINATQSIIKAGKA